MIGIFHLFLFCEVKTLPKLHDCHHHWLSVQASHATMLAPVVDLFWLSFLVTKSLRIWAMVMFPYVISHCNCHHPSPTPFYLKTLCQRLFRSLNSTKCGRLHGALPSKGSSSCGMAAMRRTPRDTGMKPAKIRMMSTRECHLSYLIVYHIIWYYIILYYIIL